MSWSSVVIEILFYIAYAGLFFQGIKRKEESDEDFSKITAQSLKGICCLAIFGHHYGQMSGEPVLSIFAHFGYLVLNIFFLISGYGVMYGLRNKEHYLDTFLIRRCGKIILCYWIMNGITVIMEYILQGEISIDGWGRGLKIFFLKDAYYTQASWYIMMLFWLYFSFYLTARFMGRYLQTVMFFAISGIIIYNIIRGMPLWYYNYLYSFNVGIYMVCREKTEEKRQFFLKLFGSITAFILLFCLSKIDRMIEVSASIQVILNILAVLSSTALAVAVMLVMEKIKMESKILYTLGGISTSIYIFHTCIMMRIQSGRVEQIKNWGICLWASLGITIVVSLGIKRLLTGKSLNRREKIG